MDDSTKSTSWLVKYGASDLKPDDGTHGKGRPRDWNVSVQASHMTVGDLMFFWEDSAKGGLRGWGLVAERSTQANQSSSAPSSIVSVVEHVWLDEIVRLPETKAGAIDQRAIGLSKEKILNLPEDQTKELAQVFPWEFRPPKYQVVRQARARMDPLPSMWITGVTSTAGLGEMSEGALEILRLALLPETGRTFSISTTRLFLACCTYARQLTEESSVDEEDIGLLCLGRVLNDDSDLGEAASRLRKAYSQRSQDASKAASSVSVTSNATNVLHQASRLSASPFGKEQTISQAVLAALLVAEKGRVLRQSEATGLSMDRVRSAVLARIGENFPRVATDWIDILGIEESAALGESQLQAEPAVALPGNDDPWREDIIDRLGAEEEAMAFARFAAARALVPPTAVGVFGDWGSGKSFFLNLVYRNVKALSESGGAELHGGPLYRNVVQIRFNAWHYVDTNLWASLVDHVFVELDGWIRKDEPSKADQLFDRLSTARELTLEAAEKLVAGRRQQAEVKQGLALREGELIEAKRKAAGDPRAFWAAVTKQFLLEVKKAGLQTELTDATKAAGLDTAANDARQLAAAIDAATDEGRRGKLLIGGLLRQLGSPLVMIAFVAIGLLLPIVVLGIKAWLAGVPSLAFMRDISDASASVSAVVTTIVATTGWALSRVRNALDKIASFQGRLNTAVDDRTKSEAAAAKKAEQEVARAAVEVEQAKAALVTSSEHLAAASLEFSTGTGRGRLMEFVRERVTSGQYAKHLGLVATIRRDFEQLSAGIGAEVADGRVQESGASQAFRKRVEALKLKAGDSLNADELLKLDAVAKDKPVAERPGFDRIVLYIDDLDRCVPEKVVEVLQAVHLLLSFRLFVVFVAVDVRWVSQALEAHHRETLTLTADATGRRSASTHDYLEKIFQIPYWVRPMNKDGSERMLSDIYQRGATVAPGVGADPPKVSISPPQPLPEGQSVEGISAQQPTAPAPTHTEVLDREESEAKPPTENVEVASRGAGAGSSKENIRLRAAAATLQLSQDELAFMKSLAGHIANSPRRALRFMNVYRVIKASLAENGVMPNPQACRTLMSQVAIVTGAPSSAQAWLQALEGERDGSPLGALVKGLANGSAIGTKRDHANLIAIMGKLSVDNVDRSVSAVRNDARYAMRYSFTGSDLA